MAALPTTSLSFSAVQSQYGGSNPISFSEYYRGGAYVPSYTAAGTYGGIATSGSISVGTFRQKGKFSFSATIAVNTTNYNLSSAASAAGWDGVTTLIATITVNSGVYVYASSTGAYAFDTGGSFPGGYSLALVNNGLILGCGGAGGAGCAINNATFTNPTAGSSGGPALNAQVGITVTNNGTIAGGGGGGGGGGGSRGNYGKGTFGAAGGGGSGGGRPLGTGGSGGSATGNAANSSGTGGGTGTLAAVGAAGARGVIGGISGGGPGVAGGALGTAGATGGNPDLSNGNYYAGGYRTGAAGGGAGNYVVGNSNVSWAATGTRLGGVA